MNTILVSLAVLLLTVSCSSSSRELASKNDIKKEKKSQNLNKKRKRRDCGGEETATPVKDIWAKQEKKKRVNLIINSKKNRRKIANIESLYSMVDRRECRALVTRKEIRNVDRIISRLGGNLVDPYSYPSTVAGLQMFIEDVGLNTRKFTAKELVEPNHQHIANSCNYKILLPKRCQWISAAAIGMIASKFRQLVDSPIVVRNWWRPKCYNGKVGGIKDSDHLGARAFDLDFVSAKKRVHAQKWLCDFYREEEAPISVGIGGRVLHVGINTGYAHKYWTYSSLDNVLKRAPGDNCWRQKEASDNMNNNYDGYIYKRGLNRGF
jgi:hypothetical protein